MVKNILITLVGIFTKGVEVGVTPPGSIGNVYSSKLNMKIPGQNYNLMNCFHLPQDKGAVASAHGTPDYYQQVRRGV